MAAYSTRLSRFWIQRHPGAFTYTFDGYARFLERFRETLGLERYSLYLHDYGSQIGLRLAMSAPERIESLIIQNGDIYEDTLGPKYDGLKKYWDNPTPERRKQLEKAVTEQGFAMNSQAKRILD